MIIKSKTQLHEELQTIFEFTPDELALNREGKFSLEQQVMFQQVLSSHSQDYPKSHPENHMLSASHRVAPIILASLGMLACGFIGLNTRIFNVQTIYFMGLFVVLILAMLLPTMIILPGYLGYLVGWQPKKYPPPFNPHGGFNVDVERREIMVLQGRPTMPKYLHRYLKVRKALFPLSEEQYRQMKGLIKSYPVQVYSFYYLKRSKIILSAEPTSMDKSYWFEKNP